MGEHLKKKFKRQNKLFNKIYFILLFASFFFYFFLSICSVGMEIMTVVMLWILCYNINGVVFYILVILGINNN